MNILFVCHGNICRSPMAEFILKELVRKAGMESRFRIASAATSREELGNPPLSARPASARGPRDPLLFPCRPANHKGRLFRFRPHHRHGRAEPGKPSPLLRRRPRGKNFPPPRPHPRPRPGRRPLVYGRLRSRLARHQPRLPRPVRRTLLNPKTSYGKAIFAIHRKFFLFSPKKERFRIFGSALFFSFPRSRRPP